jgi:hypothetical protein
MKPHEPKKRNKTMLKRRGKTKDDKNKNQFDKKRKDNKTLSQKKAKRSLSSHYRLVLLPHYELVPLPASVGYIQTISNDVARASPRLVPPPVSRVCHCSGPDLFLCCHKSIVACASQLCLVVGYAAFSRPTFFSIQHGRSDRSSI